MFIQQNINTFLACWFKFETYKLAGYLHTVVNDNINEPHIFYQMDINTEYPVYEDMVVVDIMKNEIIRYEDKLSNEEIEELHRFIQDNKECLLQFWNDGESFELCEEIKL